MLKLALIGREIQHSLSPQVYKELYQGEICYDLIDIAKEDDLPLLNSLCHYDGISITAPYKTSYLSQLTHISNKFQNIGINCLYYRNGKWLGSNTDYLALSTILATQNNFDRWIILGNGVMGKICRLIAEELDIKVINFNRKTYPDYFTQIDLSPYKNSLIINCCARSYRFNGQLAHQSVFYDLNYNMPEHESWLKKIGYSYFDGKELLTLQAKAALEYFIS
jgi:shikimate dehydrogenase